jgi:hypothetical protein
MIALYIGMGIGMMNRATTPMDIRTLMKKNMRWGVQAILGCRLYRGIVSVLVVD